MTLPVKCTAELGVFSLPVDQRKKVRQGWVGTTQGFINGWMDKQKAVYTHTGILFSLKKGRPFWHMLPQG